MVFLQQGTDNTEFRGQRGYARVSKTDDSQTTIAQEQALTESGCKRIFADRASGGRWDRPELHKLIDHAREGDIIVVVRLDRLSRSLVRPVAHHRADRGQGRGSNRSPRRSTQPAPQDA
jgi:predicted site-specific integrase-resolvase